MGLDIMGLDIMGMDIMVPDIMFAGILLCSNTQQVMPDILLEIFP